MAHRREWLVPQLRGLSAPSLYKRSPTGSVFLKLKSQLAQLLIKTVVVVTVGGRTVFTAADTCCVDIYLVTLVLP